MASIETKQMLLAAVSASAARSAKDTRLLALGDGGTELTEFLLITSGSNPLRVLAISDEIELRLQRDFGRRPEAVEGRRSGEWVLMDYADFVVHIFVPSTRATLDIENLRRSAIPVDTEQLRRTVSRDFYAGRKGEPLIIADEALSNVGKLSFQGSAEAYLLAACAVVLFIAATTSWPYFFYVLLRFLICGTAAFIALKRYAEERILWVWVFAAIAVLFNPIFPVRMSRSDWEVVNVMVGIFFSASTVYSAARAMS